MTKDELKQTVLKSLGEIAPETDPATLKTGKDVREQMDIDSMDFLNFVVELKKATGIEVPEADYDRIAAIDDCVAYLQAKLAARG